jgi:hypothetical protein
VANTYYVKIPQKGVCLENRPVYHTDNRMIDPHPISKIHVSLEAYKHAIVANCLHIDANAPDIRSTSVLTLFNQRRKDGSPSNKYRRTGEDLIFDHFCYVKVKKKTTK